VTDGTALDDLRWHYGEAYLIEYFETAGKWVAQRRDSHGTMSADAPDRLLDLIREDYRKHPVSRSADTVAPNPRPCRFLPDG
jgi:hypothetical protein